MLLLPVYGPFGTALALAKTALVKTSLVEQLLW
jgi:hypothetical protein